MGPGLARTQVLEVTISLHGLASWDTRRVKILSLGLGIKETAMVLSKEGGSNLEVFPTPPPEGTHPHGP